MKCLVVIAVILLAQQSSAFFWKDVRNAANSVGNWASGVVNVGCKRVCPQVCPRWTFYFTGCRFTCRIACKRKRGMDDTVEVDMPVDGHVIPMMSNPSFYDVDEDGRLSLLDILTALHLTPNDQVFTNIFQLADLDGDGYLTYDEFLNGPFVFEDETALIGELTRPENPPSVHVPSNIVAKRYPKAFPY